MRFYVSSDSIFPDKNIIKIRDEKEIHHIRDVMRLGEGVRVDVFDGKGREYSGDIKYIKRDSVIIEIKETKAFKDSRPYSITLFQAIPKKGKMDFIVEKAVELGVTRIVPVVTQRTVWRIDGQRSAGKVERWRRVCKAAAKQCGRTRLPLVSEAEDFKTAIKEAEDEGLVIFAALDKEAVPLMSVLKGAAPKNIFVFVGPEGDFSEKEIAVAKEKFGAVSSLGGFVLRVETAAIYILSCLNYQYGVQG